MIMPKLTKTRKPKAKPIVEEATQPIHGVEPITTKQVVENNDTISISIQSIKSINLDTDGKEYKETFWGKFCDKLSDKLSDLEPSWVFRLRDNIYGLYRDFTSSFTNWRIGYGWIPNSDIWNLYSTISNFTLPRLKLFIEKQNSTPMAFAELENGNQKWIETLTAMLPAFMEEEDWFKWKYPNRVHPFDIYLEGYIKPINGYKDGVNFSKWSDQYDWEAIRAIGKEHLEERQKGIELFAKHFYSLWD